MNELLTLPLRLLLRQVRLEADGICSYELLPAAGPTLPAFTAGAHIDLQLPQQMVRSYSLVNDPAETQRYVIAVQLDEHGRGGSHWMHHGSRVGQLLQASMPVNDFALADSPAPAVFIAGGIGITPIVAMLKRLNRLQRPWQLHYAARSPQAAAFVDEVTALAGAAGTAQPLTLCFSASGGERLDIAGIVANAASESHLYCCGPPRMIDAFTAACAALPATRVHTERYLAKGILTSTGGKASHAAVVARGWGKPCVVGCEAVKIDEKAQTVTIGTNVIKAGDFLTIDGTTGNVMIGKVETIPPSMTGDFATLMTWADKSRTLKIRTNADSPADAMKAREFGAQGIGLCRTEHMFFGDDRIAAVREMILAESVEGREKALAKIEPFQKADFVGIFEAMDGYPVTIRLLDPPLHEFLPQKDNKAGADAVAKQIGVSVEKIFERVEELHEMNPMMGFRGCRLPLVFPEIGDMQVRAIIEAAIEVKKAGKTVLPEIMIPLVGTVEELVILKTRAIATIETAFAKHGTKVEYQIGTMIELPRACIVADKIAEEAEFFSFGTNDLTQMTFGFSRDDIKGFMPTYLAKKILPVDPFQSLDVNGVGELMTIGIKKGRDSRKAKHNQHLKVGICGEHGGDPDSVFFCHKAGMDYVSCSPFRVPIARLAAAQAALGEKAQGNK